MDKQKLTDAQVEKEIERLLNSPAVRLAKKEERMRLRRRQYLCTLRSYEKKGLALMATGITEEMLSASFDDECENEYCDDSI